ncbi:hypothetical protein [Evansella clarkii]|uniref:hypothetical protein n=1 Tax=Evansella clarkii TaxID=79879 RepID=UPI000B43E9F9|nr:hypothetical protein [Evansella clarkii]
MSLFNTKEYEIIQEEDPKLTIYQVNLRKMEIYKMHREKNLTKENLEYVSETIDRMMELDMHITCEIDFLLCDFLDAGWKVNQKYINYCIDTHHISLIQNRSDKK